MSGAKETDVVVEVYRGEPGAPERFDTFRVPYETRMNILAMLHLIYERQDPTLAFRTTQCSRGICDVCQMRVNGRKVKACSTLVKPGQRFRLEPANKRKLIRDLVTILD